MRGAPKDKPAIGYMSNGYARLAFGPDLPERWRKRGGTVVQMLPIYEDADAEILLDGLRASLTYALDAIGARIRSDTEFASVLERVDAIKRLAADLGESLDDSYRIENLRTFAQRLGREWPEEARAA